jgi:hypothetical protein
MSDISADLEGTDILGVLIHIWNDLLWVEIGYNEEFYNLRTSR